jgi:hypothetical protein
MSLTLGTVCQIPSRVTTGCGPKYISLSPVASRKGLRQLSNMSNDIFDAVHYLIRKYGEPNDAYVEFDMQNHRTQRWKCDV